MLCDYLRRVKVVTSRALVKILPSQATYHCSGVNQSKFINWLALDSPTN